MTNLKLSNEDLLSTVKSKASHERQLTVEIIELLQEVADRDLHSKMGYGSLLKFCIEELKYSESAPIEESLPSVWSKTYPASNKPWQMAT